MTWVWTDQFSEIVPDAPSTGQGSVVAYAVPEGIDPAAFVRQMVGLPMIDTGLAHPGDDGCGVDGCRRAR